MKGKDTSPRSSEIPNKLDPKRPTPRHIITKMAKLKDRERILKATREKQEVTYKGAPIRLSSDFSTETLQTRRELLYPARLSFKIGEIRRFTGKKKLKEFVNTKSKRQQMLKGLL